MEATRPRSERLGPAELRAVFEAFGAALAAHRDEIDALNVFPVPDGDTGTNLLMTVRTALDEAAKGGEDPRALARGAVLGARGNSGVILSQVVRALADAVSEDGALDADGLATALGRARELAYESVAHPVEGTILTAITAAADAAADAAEQGVGLVETAAAVCGAVGEAVARTPQLLAALRDAGVVDAGARGLELFCEALVTTLSGRPATRREVSAPPVVDRSGPVVAREAGSPEYRFEVQYLLDADEAEVPDLRETLEAIGDSVVVVGAGDLLNVHVHTNDIGAALEAGLERGRPFRIEVTYFADQIAAAPAGGAEAERTPAEPRRGGLGCVAVLPGPGLKPLAEKAGAAVVEGSAGALPSVADLLDAARRTLAAEVAVLPGHPNVIPTARQAAVLAAEADHRLMVVEAASAPPCVLAALAVYDPEAGADRVLAAMSDAAAACRSGEVVAATRDADTPVGHVRAGQFLAMAAGGAVGVADDPVTALAALADHLGAGDAEIVTLSVGGGVDADERARAVDTVKDAAPAADVEVLDGGHRAVRYFLGVE